MLDAKALQGSEIVAVAELREQILQDSPIAIAGGASVGALEMVLQILLYAVVVEQRVVDVDQEDDRISGAIQNSGNLCGVCRPITRNPAQ